MNKAKSNCCRFCCRLCCCLLAGIPCGCCLFCSFFYPPCNKQITEEVVFRPPSPPSYRLNVINAELSDYKFMLSPEIVRTGLEPILHERARFVNTSLGNSIAVLYINCNQENMYTILYSHGNAEDLGQMHKLCSVVSIAFKCDVVCYDYSGYGQSEGEPTEENLYADIKAVWDYILAFHEPKAERIILFGYSLGTAPTIDLASKVQCAGVILQSPFISSLSVACHNQKQWLCMDRFKNMEKMPKVTSPVLVIHGTNDQIIDISHGRAIYKSCPRAVEPLWVEGAGHNDVHLTEPFVERIRKFINEELSN